MTAPLDPTNGPINVGDRVYVTCPGLAQLRAIMRQNGNDPKPNHHGTVSELWDDDEILIDFDDGGGAPYPAAEVRLLVEGDINALI